jgi:hydroxymethylglutaryl-CoA lyase
MTNHVTIVEVGPRDGLQNEQRFISSRDKLHLIKLLAEAGISHIEVTSFVNPKLVPQMGDAEEVAKGLPSASQPITYTALVPNMKGLERAIACGITSVAVFASATEGFSQKNIGCSIAESLSRYKDVVEHAVKQKLSVRGYVSCVVACPYDGAVDPGQVAYVAQELYAMGCSEVSLGDTLGVSSPSQTKRLLKACFEHLPAKNLAVHFHDTYGQSITNIYVALEAGIRTIDSAVSGLGGCPFAPGAAGNVATEDVLYLLSQEGFETGVSQAKILEAVQFASDILGRSPRSRVARACGPHYT